MEPVADGVDVLKMLQQHTSTFNTAVVEISELRRLLGVEDPAVEATLIAFGIETPTTQFLHALANSSVACTTLTADTAYFRNNAMRGEDSRLIEAIAANEKALGERLTGIVDRKPAFTRS